MKLFIVTLTTILLSMTSMAHEGHDKTPGALSAPHGGQIKGTSQLYVELVSDQSGFKLYAVDHDLKTIPTKEVKIEGTMKLPKQKQSEKLAFNSSDSYLEAKVNAKGSHRYIVELNVNYKGKTEKLSFNVEPQE